MSSAGKCSREAGPGSTKLGVAAGLGVNLALWQFTPLSWLWWNVSGFATTFLVAALLSSQEQSAAKNPGLGSLEPGRVNWRMIYAFIGAYFLIIVGLCGAIETVL